MISEPLQQAVILIVDDEMANVRFLEIVLQRAGYRHIFSTTDSRQALRFWNCNPPDLVLLDLSMPHLDSFAVMDRGAVKFTCDRSNLDPAEISRQMAL